MSHQRPDPLDVDGSRPAVELVAALPRELTSQGERLVLFALAYDSYDGQTTAPAAHHLAAWTGMHLSSVRAILRDLQRPTRRRPALLAVDVRSRGKRRTLYRLLLDCQPSGHAGRLESDEPSGDAGRLEQPQPSPNHRGTVGEPSGHAGRSTVGEPSGNADPSLSLTTPSPSPASRAPRPPHRRRRPRNNSSRRRSSSSSRNTTARSSVLRTRSPTTTASTASRP